MTTKQLVILSKPNFPNIYITIKSLSVAFYGYRFTDADKLHRKTGDNCNELMYFKIAGLFDEYHRSCLATRFGPAYCIHLLSEIPNITSSHFTNNSSITTWTNNLIKENKLSIPFKGYLTKNDLIKRFIQTKNELKKEITKFQKSARIDIIINRYGYNRLSLLSQEALLSIDPPLSDKTMKIIKLKQETDNELLRNAYEFTNTLLQRKSNKIHTIDASTMKIWREQYEQHITTTPSEQDTNLNTAENATQEDQDEKQENNHNQKKMVKKSAKEQKRKSKQHKLQDNNPLRRSKRIANIPPEIHQDIDNNNPHGAQQQNANKMKKITRRKRKRNEMNTTPSPQSKNNNNKTENNNHKSENKNKNNDRPFTPVKPIKRRIFTRHSKSKNQTTIMTQQMNITSKNINNDTTENESIRKQSDTDIQSNFDSDDDSDLSDNNQCGKYIKYKTTE
eukprot:137515_1